MSASGLGMHVEAQECMADANTAGPLQESLRDFQRAVGALLNVLLCETLLMVTTTTHDAPECNSN